MNSSHSKAKSTQKRLLATQFARVEGFRALIERIYGLPITSTTTVYDLVQGNDKIKSSIERSIQGVSMIKEPTYFDDGRLELDCAVAIATVKETLKREVERKVNSRRAVRIHRTASRHRESVKIFGLVSDSSRSRTLQAGCFHERHVLAPGKNCPAQNRDV